MFLRKSRGWLCPRCKYLNPPDTPICLTIDCKRRADEPETEQEKQQARIDPAFLSPTIFYKMWKCPKCGYTNPNVGKCITAGCGYSRYLTAKKVPKQSL